MSTRFLPLTGLLHHLAAVWPLLLHLRTSGLLLAGLLLGSLLAGLLHHLTAIGPLLPHLLTLGSLSFLSLSLSLLRSRLTLLLRSCLTLLPVSAAAITAATTFALTEQVAVGTDKRDEAERGHRR